MPAEAEAELSDAEIVEECRAMLQEAVDRADFAASTATEMLDSTGIPRTDVYVQEHELRELGHFDLVLPPGVGTWAPEVLRRAMCRHWVYAARDGSAVHTLSFKKRLELRVTGAAQVHVFVKRGKAD